MVGVEPDGEYVFPVTDDLDVARLAILLGFLDPVGSRGASVVMKAYFQYPSRDSTSLNPWIQSRAEASIADFTRLCSPLLEMSTLAARWAPVKYRLETELPPEAKKVLVERTGYLGVEPREIIWHLSGMARKFSTPSA